MDCVVAVAAVDTPLELAAAAPGAATALAGVAISGFAISGFHTGIILASLTSQHCLTTQHATVGQQHVTGHGQQQHVEVVQLVH